MVLKVFKANSNKIAKNSDSSANKTIKNLFKFKKPKHKSFMSIQYIGPNLVKLLDYSS